MDKEELQLSHEAFNPPKTSKEIFAVEAVRTKFPWNVCQPAIRPSYYTPTEVKEGLSGANGQFDQGAALTESGKRALSPSAADQGGQGGWALLR